MGKVIQDNHEFEVSLGYVERPCLEKRKELFFSEVQGCQLPH
jgi:hypothetical protein